MKISLVGPITGVPDHNAARFDLVAHSLEGQGHDVVNPTRLDVSTKGTWEECLAETIPHICRADWIVVLHDWPTSRGSLLEVAVALLLKKPIYRLVSGRLVPAHPDLGEVLCLLLDAFAPGAIPTRVFTLRHTKGASS